MSNKGARNLFIIGSAFFFLVFLALTVDTMKQVDKRTPPITDEVNAGKMAWHKYDCIGCHTILGNGSYFAPDMTTVVNRKPLSFLKQYLMDPRAVNPKAAMPKLGITSDEADRLLDFLIWISKVDTNGWPPKPVLAEMVGAAPKPTSRGEQLYKDLGCAGCHAINGVGGTSGPDLSHVGSVRDRAWLKGHFKNPRKFVPNSAMPQVAASDKDLDQLTDYMQTLK